jgi:hypothetical protein
VSSDGGAVIFTGSALHQTHGAFGPRARNLAPPRALTRGCCLVQSSAVAFGAVAVGVAGLLGRRRAAAAARSADGVRAGPSPRRKRVGIVGAGPSGLVVAKELMDQGHEVRCVPCAAPRS